MKTKWKNLRREVREALERLRKAVQPRAKPPAPPEGLPKLGLALGGGFSRGMAHVGIIKALEEENIPVSFIAGTSIGSIIATAYASGASVEDMALFGEKIHWHDFGKWTLSKMGLASNKRLEVICRGLFKASRFEDIKIPLAVIATNLATGRPVVFKKGELVLPVRASCAYPGLFLPVEHDGMQLVDGGLVRTVPTQSARDLGADVVLGVALNNIDPSFELRHIADVLARSFSIAMQAAEPIWRGHADVVAEPRVEQYAWDDFARTRELIAAGETALRKVLPRLRELLHLPEPEIEAPAKPPPPPSSW